eukprot:15485024-Alexandrium_andersonii.AAC.1
MNRPATMYLAVLTKTVGKAVVGACKGGLMDGFAHRNGVEAMFSTIKMQKRMVDSCTHFKGLFQQATERVGQYW